MGTAVLEWAGVKITVQGSQVRCPNESIQRMAQAALNAIYVPASHPYVFGERVRRLAEAIGAKIVEMPDIPPRDPARIY